MKKSLLLITGVFLTVCLIAGCGAEVKAYTDPEEKIDISANKEFVILIALESNPTTGYSWQAGYDETMLELVEETYELGEYAKQGLIGAGGTELFRFKALKSGEVEITMSYKRPWETDVLDRKIFTVEVRLGEAVLGRGSGKSKKVAETEAARSALERSSTNFTR